MYSPLPYLRQRARALRGRHPDLIQTTGPRMGARKGLGYPQPPAPPPARTSSPRPGKVSAQWWLSLQPPHAVGSQVSHLTALSFSALVCQIGMAPAGSTAGWGEVAENRGEHFPHSWPGVLRTAARHLPTWPFGGSHPKVGHQPMESRCEGQRGADMGQGAE